MALFNFDDDVRPRTFPHACVGGKESTEFSWWAKDGRGIPLCRVCPDCEKEKLAQYRPEILGYYTENDVDEAIEPDDGDGGFYGEDW